MSDFQALRERSEAEYAAWRRPERPRIDVAMDTSSIANGAGATRQALEARARERNAAVEFGRVAGYGIQWLHPLVTITWPDGASVLYGPVRAGDADRILDEATGLVGAAAGLAIGTVAGSRPGVPSIRDHPFFACEPAERRLLRNIGLTDPQSLEHYVATGGYAAAARMLERHQSGETVRQLMIDAGLLGRGGAAFPAGVKWGFLSGAPGEHRYVVCNADEGDPGAWVNRVILDGDPHLLIEGMLIGAHAMNGTHGFIYLRDEYPLALERMNTAIAQAEAAGLLGDDILGSGLSFRIEVFRGAGSYVCGDEMGLLASMTDERGMPRIKPPFPAGAGVFYRPSNVNNVESYANAPFILRHDAGWYRELGTEAMSGTRIFSLSGDVPRAGFMELPFGTPAAGVLAACGGVSGGGSLRAILAGGPLGSVLPGSLIDELSFDPASFQAHGGALGAGGVVFASDRACVIDVNRMVAEFVEDESCGRCTTCHAGTQRMTELFRRISEGGGRREDRHSLELIASTLAQSNCAHGQLSPNVLKNTFAHFEDDYEAHVAGRCEALVCAGLVRYTVVDQSDPALAAAAAICPVAAITGEPGEYAIDGERCIRCDACRELAPRGVVREAVPIEPRIVAL